MGEPVSPIGGYFGLDVPGGDFPHSHGLLLNSGRACMELLLRRRRPARVHVPRYTCDVVIEPMRRLGIPVAFYPVSAQLRPDPLPAVATDEMIVVNNYFGLQDADCPALSASYGDRLILDCSQALHAPAAAGGAYTFYTPRKFCGVADGGILIGAEGEDEAAAALLPRDVSWARASHLLQRLDEGARAGYAAFLRNDASLTGLAPMRMSRLTHRLLEAHDHEGSRLRRHANFDTLHAALGRRNALVVPDDGFACPMVYPFVTTDLDVRARLLDAGIFVATYWPNVKEWCEPGSVEYRLTEELIPLPIDQRYGVTDMQRILSVIE